jgi:hypothetical protein
VYALSLYDLLGFAVSHMNLARVAIFLEFETLRIVLLVFLGCVVAALAGCASQRDHNAILFSFACHFFLRSSGGCNNAH